MKWHDQKAPGLEELAALGEACFRALPGEFRQLCEGISMRVDEFPSDEVIEQMGLESPFEISGLYQGVDLTQKSVGDVAPLPDMIFLYRRPILDEWAEGEVTLRELLTHIIVHEIGHHFGLSDETMHEIEDGAGP